LADRVSEAQVNLVFKNDAWKVIKDAFKRARCISVVIYYMQVNLILFCMQVLK
jgi:hypothetical protein